MFAGRRPPPLSTAALRRIAQTVLTREAVKGPAELTFIFTNPAETRNLNRRFRGVDRPTDVIAFRYDTSPAHRGLAGDLFINVPQARRQARRFRHTLQSELTLLAIHGILHLLNYADEWPAARRVMFRRQASLLRTLKARA